MTAPEGGRVDVRGLTWRPAGRRVPVLRDLDLSVRPGERVLLAGPSGAGKSTLLRALAGLLLTADIGDLGGQVLVDGDDPGTVPGRVGLLLQDPTAAVVAERAGRDVAFGLENLRVSRERLWPRVHEALAAVGFPYGVDHPTAALSGGETQRLALAGMLALGPRVLLLDEPTSMLDPAAAADVREAVLAVAAARRCTLVVVEHRLGPWLEHADRLVVMDRDGRLVADGDPATVLREHGTTLAGHGVWVPGLPDPEPVDLPAGLVTPYHAGDVNGQELLRGRGLVVRHQPRWLARDRTATLALDGVDADLRAGSVLGVTGRSGSGKSTLLGVLAGLARPDSGRVEVTERLAVSQGPRRSRGRVPWKWRSSQLAARLAWVPQHPEHGVVARTVREEVLVASRALGRPAEDARRRGDALLEALGLAERADASPYRLSGGEQRRLMLAAALAHGPSALLLDEPTVGQDRGTWAATLGAFRSAAAAGAAAALATHDTAAVHAIADRDLVLARGRSSR